MGFSIQVNPQDQARLKLRLDTLARTAKPTMKAALQEAAGVIVDWIKYGLLSGRVLKVRTGNLRDSIMTMPVADGVKIYQDTAKAPYGPVFEFGVTHAWDIYPRTAKALRFTAGGKVVFSKHVVHPPQEPRPFMSRGVEEKRDAAMLILEKAFQRLIRG